MKICLALLIGLNCFFFLQASNADNLEPRLRQALLRLLKVNKNPDFEKNLVCGESQKFKFVLPGQELPSKPERLPFNFKVGTEFSVKCGAKDWEIEVNNEFEWAHVRFPKASVIQLGLTGTKWVMPAQNIVFMNNIEVKNAGKITAGVVSRTRDFKENFIREVGQVEVISSSLETGVTQLRVLEPKKNLLFPFPVGSIVKFHEHEFVSGVLSEAINRYGFLIPKGSTIWRTLNGAVVLLREDAKFLDFNIPKDSYIIYDSHEWSKIYLSKDTSYNGKVYPAKKLILNAFNHFSGKDTGKKSELIELASASAGVVDGSKGESSDAVDFEIAPSDTPGLNFFKGRFIILPDPNNLHIREHEMVVALGRKEISYAFHSDQETICGDGADRFINCTQKDTYTILSDDESFWGVAYQMNGVPNITSLEEVEFKPYLPKIRIIEGAIKCAPRTEEASLLWNVNLQSKKVKIDSRCDHQEIASLNAEPKDIVSVESFKEMSRVSFDSGAMYFLADKISYLTGGPEGQPTHRLIVDGKSPVFFRKPEVGRYKYRQVRGRQGYLDPDDAGC